MGKTHFQHHQKIPSLAAYNQPCRCHYGPFRRSFSWRKSTSPDADALDQHYHRLAWIYFSNLVKAIIE